MIYKKIDGVITAPCCNHVKVKNFLCDKKSYKNAIYRCSLDGRPLTYFPGMAIIKAKKAGIAITFIVIRVHAGFGIGVGVAVTLATLMFPPCRVQCGLRWGYCRLHHEVPRQSMTNQWHVLITPSYTNTNQPLSAASKKNLIRSQQLLLHELARAGVILD